jgi:NADH-quinone oxidoreductase subunit F
VVNDIGGGTGTAKKIKAVQTGGPSGGCIPADKFSSTVDYESLAALGAIMGSGGIVVMDEDNCMVDVARYFTSFAANESCGKCAPCREGVYRSKELLEAITSGKATEADIDRLGELNTIIRDTALCGLGQTAPNPVLTTIRYFRNEYESHINGRQCDALVCKPLITYTVDVKNCTGCTLCAKKCPAVTISGEPKKTHRVIQSGCTHCGTCFNVCRFNAIARNGRLQMVNS